MRKYTYNTLIDEGYTVENALIKSVDLSMADHGCLTLAMTLDGSGWGVVYGGYCLGHGYLGADEETFRGSAAGMEYLLRIMDTVGVERFQDLKDKYVRVKSEGWGSTMHCIGNLIEDKWFDLKEFFEKDDGHAIYVLDEREPELEPEDEDEEDDYYDDEWHSVFDNEGYNR